MYESFYQLKEKPFSLLPDPDFLYLGGKYQTALSLLEYGVLNQAGFIVLTGEPGMGKTTLLRKLVELMKTDFSVGLVTNTHRDFGSLLPWILAAFGLPSENRDALRMFQELGEFLRHQMLKQRRVLLIVDEAQNLTPGMLEELRLLSNLNAQKVQTLQVLLCGQSDLRSLLKRPDLIQFAQRVSVDYHLVSLQEGETEEYIRHRLRVAGGPATLFTHEACVAAHRLTGGLPRLINQACDMALSYGFAEQAPRIVAKLVIDAVRDREVGGLIPVVGGGHLLLEAEETEEAIPPFAVVTASSIGTPEKGSSVSVERVRQEVSKSVSLAAAVSEPLLSAVTAQPATERPHESPAVLHPIQVKDRETREEAAAPALMVPGDKAGTPAGAERGGLLGVAPRLSVQKVDESKAEAVSAGSIASSLPLDPGKYEALYKRGVQLKKVGRFKDAIRTLEQAAQHSDYWMKAYAQVALCFREAGRPIDAVSAFRKALTKAGTTPSSDLRVRYEFGKTLHALGKRAEAIEQFRLISQADPGYLDIADRLKRLGAGAASGTSKQTREVSDSSWVNRAWGGLQGLLRRSH
ncbi:MAG: hypothetical protein E8D45_00440 [Nitrospira sp.]|nr:MAG: hypothetical protein E8D45_00440 [Nitrospira sp.]